MPLTFLCPNGHRLSCADEQAGMAGQCPECGVRFRIPLPEQPDDAPLTDEHAADDEAAASPADAEEGAALSTPPERIVFLCPNGHRLHGPAHLAGRAGQCPHCGAKFRIPPLEEVPSGEALFESVEDEGAGQEYVDENVARAEYEGCVSADDFEQAGEPSANGSAEYVSEYVEDLPPDVDDNLAADTADDETSAGVDWPGVAGGERRRESLFGIDSDRDDQLDEEPPPGAETPHPLAELCDRLWAETASGAKIELVLADGNHIVVHHFARSWSQRSHGLFACREGDGTYTLTAIAWDSIARVIARGVPELAEDLSN
ncbi:MAG: hypothetical protein K2Y37_13820 [Pirellulales bacterium]|nr:hypothetical protein [Pirellulales bacterium]